MDLPSQPPRPNTRRRAHIALAGCTVLLIVFGVMSHAGVRTKSATYDEPLHVVGAYVHRYQHDYRINAEDPALLGLWASIPLSRNALRPNYADDNFAQALKDPQAQWGFVIDSLYHTPQVDPDAVVNRARVMFTLVGVALGMLIAWWAWRLAGPIAAVVATGLYAFDPNFRGHASLVKNDVPMSLMLVAMALSVWELGRTGHWKWIILIALACAGAINVKFSGPLLLPICAVLLVVRAIRRETWTVLNAHFRSVRSRLGATAAMGAFILIVCVVVTWALYGFRFSGTPNAELQSMELMDRLARVNELFAASNGTHAPTYAELERHPSGRTMSTVLWMHEYHLLPQAWLVGFGYTYMSTLLRGAYLMGEHSLLGFVGYYPLAMLFKTPLGTLALIFASMPILLLLRPQDRWTWTCLLVPPGIYLAVAMSSHINIGLRHVLPVYPFGFVIVGVACALALERWRNARLAVAACLVLLLVESVSAWPNDIAFFNWACGGSRGGLRLLSDSNLDWGQDLSLLVQWRDSHRDAPLYLNYFGTADANRYGLDVTSGLPPGWPTTPAEAHGQRAYVAISATRLQGTYTSPENRAQLETIRHMQPLIVLGGTIYVYEWPR